MPEESRLGSETAFAALALRRCRDRIAALLDAVAEPRRGALAAAIAELEGQDDERLKQALSDLVRRDEQALFELAARELGPAIETAPRVARLWIARSARR